MANMSPRKKSTPLPSWWTLDLSRQQLIWSLVIALVFFSSLSLYNAFAVYQVRQETRSDLDKLKLEIRYLPLGVPVDEALEAIEASGDLSSLAAKSLKTDEASLASELSNVFGDTFSGLAYIDTAKTDLFWDENMTAFTMPPVFEFKKLKDCNADSDCVVAPDSKGGREVCLKSACLSVTPDNKLLFKGRALALPKETSILRFREVSLYGLEDEWLIGLIAGVENDEAVWVYRFDGRELKAIVGPPAANTIRPEYQLGNGKVAFGGDKDDFMVLYSGYDGRAFRFYSGFTENISRFFGFRVTAGGFTPQIIKSGQGKETIFYICGIDAGKPKLLKLWNKHENSSGGALDLSPLVFKGLAVDEIRCNLSAQDKHGLEITVVSGKRTSLWRFIDKGFDNSRARQVSSINLASGAAKKMKAVVFRAIGLDLPVSFSAGDAHLEVSNDSTNFFALNSGEKFVFSTAGNYLYWRLRFEPVGETYFSPWFDHINSLIYFYE